MGFARLHETGLGVPAEADYLAASATGELIEAETVLPGGDDRGWLIDDAPSLIDSFLSFGADTLFFESDGTPDGFGEPVEEAEDIPPPGGTSPVAAEPEGLAGDLTLPADAGGDGSAPAFPDWFEPDFDFAATGASESEADGVASDVPPTAAGASAAPAVEDIDLPGDVIPPPDEPEDMLPIGDVLPAPEDEETGPFIGDDGSVVDLDDLPDAFEFLLL